MDVGDRLPDVRLTRPDGKPVDLGTTRGAPLLLFPPPNQAKAAYIRGFLAEAATLDLWSGHPLVVVRSTHEAAALVAASDGAGARVAIDPGGALRERVGVDEASWALVVADRWGIVYHVARANGPEALPDMAELREWAKFLATQCPECGVIDWPA